MWREQGHSQTDRPHPQAATLEAAFVRDGIAVHHVGDASTLDPSASSNVARAIVHIVPPPPDGGELRDYKRRMFAELDALAAAMPTLDADIRRQSIASAIAEQCSWSARPIRLMRNPGGNANSIMSVIPSTLG
jgi:hypothetical protein